MQQPYFIYNGESIPSGTVIFSPENRLFRYGDGLFESVRVVAGKPCFITLHFERLIKGADYLGLKFPAFFTEEYLRGQIEILLQKNKLQDARLRLTLFRKDGGFYAPATNEVSFVIDAFPLHESRFCLSEKGLTIGICDKVKRQQHPLSNFKTCNSLIAVLASNWKKEKGLDECILINGSGRVAEGSASNIFILTKYGELKTPTLEEGCVDGVMRRVVIEICKEMGQPVLEQQLSLKDVENALEVFFTNAVKGLMWVERFNHSTYQSLFSKQIVESLNAKLP